jgi:hypothetical protein
MSVKKTSSKKLVKSPIKVTAEQEALLHLNNANKKLTQDIAGMQAWMKVTQDMLLGIARLTGLDAKAFAKAIDESERNKAFELDTVDNLKQLRASAEKKVSKSVPKRAVDAPVVKAKKTTKK